MSTSPKHDLPKVGALSHTHTQNHDGDTNARYYSDGAIAAHDSDDDDDEQHMHRGLSRKLDWRLCTIAGVLCSLNLMDSGIISSASVTTIFGDLGLGVGNRYVSAFLGFGGRGRGEERRKRGGEEDGEGGRGEGRECV